MSTIRNNIISHLEKRKGSYEPNVDDYLIDELVINKELSDECLQKIKDEGIIIYTVFAKSGASISKLNPAVNAYQMFQRNINQLSAKLGINRADRIKLKLLAEKEADEFEDDFGK